jgi:hypothetical protein
MKSLFDRINESHAMQLEKELISLDPHSFDIIEDYLVCVKELQLKLGKCGKNYLKTDEQLIELVRMNLRTPFELSISNFSTSLWERKEDGKDYTFEALCGLLITNQHILLDQGKLGGKRQARLLKGMGKSNCRIVVKLAEII